MPANKEERAERSATSSRPSVHGLFGASAASSEREEERMCVSECVLVSGHVTG